MRFRTLLRRLSRRIPAPRPNEITVRWVDDWPDDDDGQPDGRSKDHAPRSQDQEPAPAREPEPVE